MIKYRTTDVIGLTTGRILLTDAQAKTRLINLDPVDPEKGIYDIKGAVQFKAGEEIGLEYAPDKYLTGKIINLEPEKPPAKKPAAKKAKKGK